MIHLIIPYKDEREYKFFKNQEKYREKLAKTGNLLLTSCSVYGKLSNALFKTMEVYGNAS